MQGGYTQGSSSRTSERDRRLDGNVKTLYHQTDEAGSRAIRQEGFRRGESGIAGPGIYFAESAAETKKQGPQTWGYLHSARALGAGQANRSPWR
jgi:hypothetical protein